MKPRNSLVLILKNEVILLQILENIRIKYLHTSHACIQSV